MAEEIVHEEHEHEDEPIHEHVHEHNEYGHGRPVWRTLLIYLIIAIIVYAVIYYLFLGRRNASSQSPSPANTSQPAY